jgi:hypothetical protein
MDDNTLEQRIRYLIEHGGVYDDPLDDIRRGIRWAIGIGAVALICALANLLV